MTYNDNPAGLLHHWLSEMLRYDQALAVSQVVCRMLELDHETLDGRSEVLRFGATLADLCTQTRSEAALLPESLSPEMVLGSFDQVETAVDIFTLARQQPVSNMMALINPAGWQSLEFLSTYLHLNRPHHQLTNDVRDSLLAQVRALIDGVTGDASLPLDVKSVVLDRLMGVEKALRFAFMAGTAPVERAAESLIGSWHNPVKRDLWAQIGETTWGPRIGNMAIALCLALGASADGFALMAQDSPIPIEYNITIINDGPAPEVHDPDPSDVVEAEIVEDEAG